MSKELHPKVTTWWALHRRGPVGYFTNGHWAPLLFRTRAEARKYEQGVTVNSRALFTAKRVRLVITALKASA